MVAESCLSERVTGLAATAETVTDTPGSRFVRVLFVEVTVCAAAVPGQSVTDASDALWMAAEPVTAIKSVAVPAATSLGDP